MSARKSDDDDVAIDVEDLSSLPELTEDTLLRNLKRRFEEDLIYTNIGTILLSVNPFKLVPIYSPDVVQRYISTGELDNAPHIYGLANSAYRDLFVHGSHQCCVISGESGSGKTEATKLILQYITEKSKSSPDMHRKILEMNPLLEAFGNAKTEKNKNSSRFGKLIQMYICKKRGTTEGVAITEYLLEKSRVVKQAKDERNYHIFYQLCSAAKIDPNIGENLRLGYPEEYFYLTQSGNPDDTGVNGVNDSQTWKKTINAMEVIGLVGKDRETLLTTLAAILNLGNVRYKILEGSSTTSIIIDNPDVLDVAAHQLGVNAKDLEDALLQTSIETSVDAILRRHTASQAEDARNAFAKEIYGLIFRWLVKRINKSLVAPKQKSGLRIINILDIFGFEDFKRNSYEQLCINYCNEKLQLYFIEHVFKNEQRLYLKEGIEIEPVSFADNTVVIKLIEDNHSGIFALLNDENKLPNGSESVFLQKLLQNTSTYKGVLKKPAMTKSEREQGLNVIESFNIVHYAGEVRYSIKSFLEKNRDMLLPALESLGMNSKNKLISALFLSRAGARSASKKKVPTKKKNRMTIATQFKNQLSDLMKVLHKSKPHFIRCIKPNDTQERDAFDTRRVLAQIRYAGLLSVCNIHKNGYPIKYDFKTFQQRFGFLVSHGDLPDHQKLVKELERKHHALANTDWQIGNTKIFIRNSQHATLESIRELKLGEIATIIQKLFRGYLERLRYTLCKNQIDALSAAMKTNAIEALERAILDSDRLPDYLPILKDAKQLLSDLLEQKRVLDMMEKAVTRRDRAAIKSLMLTAKTIGIEQSHKVLKKAKATERSLEKEYFKTKSNIYMIIAAEINALEVKSSSSSGVERRDLEKLRHALSDAGSAGMRVNDVELQHAREFYAQMEAQVQANILIREALQTEDEDDVSNALRLVETLGLETLNAKKVKEIVLRKEARKQEDFTERLTLKRDTHASKESKRLSHMIDFSGRISNLNLASISSNAGKKVSKLISASRPMSLAPTSFRLQNYYKLRSNDTELSKHTSTFSKQKQSSKVMSSSTTVISQSLLQLVSPLNDIALQINTSILQYCGDLPSQFPDLSARFILVTGLELPVLCDEIYMQLCKHLTENLNSISEDKAWILFCLVTQQFPPSTELEPYLQDFLIRRKKKPLLPGNYARLSIVQLERTINLGPSTVLPDIDLIASYSLRPPILASVRRIHNTRRVDIPVYPDIDAGEVLTKVCKYSKIPEAKHSLYGLFVHGQKPAASNQGFSDRLERFYEYYDKSKTKNVDYFAAMWQGNENLLFERLVEKYGPEPPATPRKQKRTNKFIFKNGRVTKATKRVTPTKTDFEHPIPWWVCLGDVYLRFSLIGQEPIFTIKRKLIRHKERPGSELISQLSQQVASGELLLSDINDACTLASISLLLKNNLKVPGSISEEMVRIEMYESWFQTKRPEKIVKAVSKTCAIIADKDKKSLQTKYLRLCKLSPCYGMSFFELSFLSPMDDTIRFVGISHAGVNFFDSTRLKILRSILYDTIVEYGATAGDVWIEYNTNGLRKEKITLSTQEAWELYTIIYDYLAENKKKNDRLTRMTYNSHSSIRRVKMR